MPSGTVKNISLYNGYGFLRQDDGGPDLFFHLSSLASDLTFDEQLVERRVSYTVSTNPRNGKPCAVDVRPLR